MIQEIQDTLITQLKTVQGLPPVQEENTLYPAKGLFCRVTTLYTRPETLTVGVTGHELHQDSIQVDVLAPVNTGTTEINNLVDKIRDTFPKGLVLDSGTKYIRILKAYRETATGRLNDQYHMVSVLIDYQVIN